jgi:DNA polymerase III epsilon subunit-like protein
VISLAIVNQYGYLLFQAIMNPGRLPERRFVWSGERIHKIYKEQILSSESPAKYYRAVQEIVKDRIIVGHTITSDQDVNICLKYRKVKCYRL